MPTIPNTPEGWKQGDVGGVPYYYLDASDTADLVIQPWKDKATGIWTDRWGVAFDDGHLAWPLVDRTLTLDAAVSFARQIDPATGLDACKQKATELRRKLRPEHIAGWWERQRDAQQDRWANGRFRHQATHA